VNDRLRREASVELTLKQAADMLRPKGAQTDVPEFRNDVMADVQLVGLESAGPDRPFDRYEPVSELPRDG
jgi:hypothetical protein